ncbi:hypothetical protein BC03BB108_F0005 (plasmid) [Bacillus cereus 03BB108]|nr:hypothetical protein BC03BB108_F0005 [Bacillus cereus 03BB108]
MLHALYNEPLPCDFLPVRQLWPLSIGNYKGRSCLNNRFQNDKNKNNKTF